MGGGASWTKKSSFSSDALLAIIEGRGGENAARIAFECGPFHKFVSAQHTGRLENVNLSYKLLRVSATCCICDAKNAQKSLILRQRIS